jgi:hypothetical protein
MGKQTKFTTQFDIEARIIKESRQLRRELELAGKHQEKMRMWWDRANDPALEAGPQDNYRQKGYGEKRLMERNLSLARRIEEVRLPKLKQALACFKTGTFAFSEDKSVVIN